MQEEIGVSGVELTEHGKFFIEEVDEADKVKKRFNMLYSAVYDGQVTPSEHEISEVRWVDPRELEKRMQEQPNDFTEGFIEGLKQFQNFTA